VSRAYRAHMTI